MALAAAAAEARLLANEAQRRAADPAFSVALSASAGSGKTRALVDRYVRLCLAGAAPRSILAVTFTNKAAVEIQDRLLARAAAYAHLAEDDLRRELGALQGREPTPSELSRAAGLQEALLEDLGGLPIGTIHSFCQSILARFAAEAGIDPRFSVLERTEELWEEALERLEREAASDPEQAAALAALAARPTGVRHLLGRLRGDVLRLERWLERLARERSGAAVAPEAAWSSLLPDALAELEREVLGPGRAGPAGAAAAAERLALALEAFAAPGLGEVAAAEEGKASEALTRFLEGKSSDARHLARELHGLGGLGARAEETEGAFEACLDRAWALVMTGSGTLRKVTAGKRAGQASRNEAFGRIAAPVIAAVLDGRLRRLLRRNGVLLSFGLRALDHYRELKRRDRCLDFQDLEHQAWRVVNDPLVGPWVQFRLDQRIDHLLVDEFQDTNDSQWGLLSPIVAELLAGPAADGSPRTVFFVGDPKQSIYGWRGAEPRLFERVAADLGAHPGAIVETLPTNFRSLPAVVRSVGALFDRPPLADHLPGGPGAARQHSARAEEDGEVVILPPLPPGEDGAAADDVAARVCATIVKRLVREGHTWESAAAGEPPRPRRLTWDDVLVLCRGRSHIATYEQALRASGVPICPAGRGLLARSREVQDVIALLRWLSYPQDDAALAAVMRSPILRFPERLFHEVLEHRRAAEETARRRRSLWWALRELSGGDPRLAEAVSLLEEWLGRVGRDDCHDLLRRIWRTGHLPQRYAAALGDQARFNLDRLLDIALGGDLGRFPTVRRLSELLRRAAAAANEEEATAPPNGAGRVRVMSVHGAKGLEAPVVLLVDADRPFREDLDELRLRPELPDGPLLYGLARDHWRRIALPLGEVVPVLAPAAEAAQRDRLREEADILYVAMTRARDRLYVLGGLGATRGERPSFHAWLAEAPAAAPDGGAGGPGVLSGWTDPDPLAPADREPPPPAASVEPVPVRAWSPPALRARVREITPSTVEAERGLASAAAGPPTQPADGTASRDAALRHGNEVHAWLQRASESGVMPAGEGDAWHEAAEVFANPEFGWIFHPERDGGCGLSEVPFIRRLPAAEEGAPEDRIVGAMDRLVLRPGRVDVIDYKTSRTDTGGPTAERLRELCEQHGEQLRLYRETAASLFPDRSVRAHLLLTHPCPEAGRGLLVTLDEERPGP